VNRALRYGVIAVGVVATLALIVVFFPWNLLRGPVAAYASQYLERPVSITAFDVEPGWTTRVLVDGISIDNTPWSKQQPMARATRMAFSFSLGGLLQGKPQRVELIEPNVLFERNAKGEANWHFGEGPTEIPEFGVLDVERGAVRYLDPILRADVRLTLQTIPSTSDAPSELRIDGKGTLRGESVQVDGRGRGLAALRNVDDPYQLAINARAGRTVVKFDGSIVPADPENVRGTLHIQGPDLSQLYPIIPSPLPWTPPYNLSGELAHPKHQWIFRRIKGTVGDSDLAGDFQLDLSQSRSKTIADLTSSRFHYKDLGGFIGLPPGNPKTAEQQSEAQRRNVSNRVLPDKPLDLAKLRDHDADVKFRGTAVRFGAVPIDNLVSRLRLANGVLSLEPLDFGIADGHVVANVKLDVNRATADAQGQIEVRRVELKQLFPKLASPEGTAGRFGGRANFKTQGNSVASMFAALDADAALIMRGGAASTLQLVLTNLDLARAAELLLRGDETAEIRCAVAALHARRGVVEPDLWSSIRRRS
jgi:AsmA family protein